MDYKISDFIADNVAPDMAKQYDEFCDWIHNRMERHHVRPSFKRRSPRHFQQRA